MGLPHPIRDCRYEFAEYRTHSIRMTLAAIVFDFDGLIVDTENPGFISWQEIYREFGAALNIDDWRHATGYVGGFDPGIHLERILGRKLDWSHIMPRRDARNWELTLQACALPGIQELMQSARNRQLRNFNRNADSSE